MNHYSPWERPGLSSAEVFANLATEAKVCMYELLRASVELRYNGTGWPANPKEWEPLEKECDAIAKADETDGSDTVPAYRYGNTYASVRWNRDLQQVVPLKNLVSLTPQEPALQLAVRWQDGFLGLVHQHMSRANYSEEIKVEFNAAFADFASFDLGAGAGASVIARLEKDEHGKKAVADVRRYLDGVKDIVKEIASKPFGIERDFVHLYHAAHYGLSSELMRADRNEVKDMEWNAVRQNLQRDTLGVEAFSTWDVACIQDETPGILPRLEYWVALYLDRVRFIATRWMEKGSTEVDARLSELAEKVKAWKGAGHFLDAAAPNVKTAVEKAQREIVQGISGTVTDAQGPATNLERIEWMGSTIEFVTVVQNLVKSHYIDLPSKNGKGDGNETELFRRLQRVIVVRNQKDEEIRPELVKNRASAEQRQMGKGRAREFELPEATRRKVMKAK